MAFVCVTVVAANLAIVAWSVVSLEDDMTFTNLFDSLKAGKYAIIPASEKLTRSEIEKVFVGTEKTTLSMVDGRLNVVEVTSKFGSYVKFSVKCEDEPQPTSSSVVLRNAFEIMRKSQQELSNRRLPQRLSERTKKDKLFNDLLNLLETKKWEWAPDGVESGRVFLTTLTNVLWYLDGHHDTLSRRGLQVPELFSPYQGYNVPQASKHRKRSAANLSCEKLACHSASLYETLLSSWINTARWAVMKEAVKGLATSIDSHISYLHDQSKRMKIHHSTPSESFGDKTNFTYLPRSSKIPGSLHELDQALSQKQVYEYVFVRDFAPTERRTRYHYIQELHKGLSRPAVLCTYTVGSSIGNYHLQPICIHCSSEDIETPVQEGYYPQCQECSDKPQISKRTSNKSA